jgi:hypothetical protein
MVSGLGQSCFIDRPGFESRWRRNLKIRLCFKIKLKTKSKPKQIQINNKKFSLTLPVMGKARKERFNSERKVADPGRSDAHPGPGTEPSGRRRLRIRTPDPDPPSQ